MQGSFVQLDANQGAKSALRRSYIPRTASRSNEEECDAVVILSISASGMGVGRWDFAGPLNAVTWQVGNC